MNWIVDTQKRQTSLGNLYGIFFEDLNHAADGGLYAELVQNRSFEFDPIDHPDYHHLTAWEKIEKGGEISLQAIIGGAISDKNPHYLAMDIKEEGEEVGIQNLGYNTGIPIWEGEKYQFTCFGKREQSLEDPIKISLRNDRGHVYASQELLFSTEWKKYELTFKAPKTDFNGRLGITALGRGKIYLDFVSLFPKSTFLNRPNGMRKDIAELLKAMNPKFMRFPGGCLVHDGALDENARDSQYRWKNTIGPLEHRPARRSNWNYNQTLGLGYFEFFQFCEDIGAEPLPVVPGGYDPHHKRYAPLDKMSPFINDALDLIEFANGDTDTIWGAKRAECGHPEPFQLKYIGIGNEEVLEEFFIRYDLIHKAIRDKYPNIKIINTGSPFAEGGEYERGWANAKKNQSDLVDEHYYMSPEWFLANHHHYDNFDPAGPKVFLGEYASWGNTWYNALVEASYMIGLERNAQVVNLACYAPMLANIDYVNWKPDMIWFNNHQVYGSPNYYVQKLFMQNQGAYGLTSIIEEEPVPEIIGEEVIYGDLLLGGNESKVLYSNLVYTNLQTGETKEFASIVCEKNQDRVKILNITDNQYQLELDAVELEGYRGMQITFGHKDSENEFNWILGGWQNLDTFMNERISGSGSDLSQHTFSVEKNRTYHLKLMVNGREIKTYVDGILYHDTRSKLPVIEPLYTCASMNEAGDELYLKAVNVSNKERAVSIQLCDEWMGKGNAEIYQMADFHLEDTNSFQEPEKIAPKIFSEVVNLPEFTFCFPKESITIIKLT